MKIKTKNNKSRRRQQFMHLAKLASKPQLVEIKLDDEETIKEFGEPLTFHTWDRQPMEVFMKLSVLEQRDVSALLEVVKTLILDEKGQPVLAGDDTLPTNVLLAAINKVTELLGKS
jgi:hypothetical protein